MKTRKTIQQICLALSLLAAVSCTDETFTDRKGKVEEGLPANIELRFQVEDSPVYTRAEQDAASESKVDNIYLLIFDAAGDVHARAFCTESNGGLTYTTGGTTGYDTGTAYLNNTTSLNNARIVGIANLTTSTTKTAYFITEEDLNKVETLTQLQELCMHLTAQSIERGDLFMMTGYAKDNNDPENEEVNIPGSEGGQASTLEATLKLERTDAKIRFNVVAEPNPQNNEQWEDFAFLPKEWTVKRVPQQSYLLEAANGGDYDGQDAVYFDSRALVFETIETDDTNSNLYAGGSFVFYMPENKKTPRQQVTNYADRDAWTTGSTGERVFTNANNNSTYVEMTGTLSYKNVTTEQLVSADVRLIVHLGYAKGADGTADPNDYNTGRNGYYTYTVRIRGINDIIVEVINNQETRPGYEGDVVYSTSNVYEFDSHYDRRLIKLERSAISRNMKWSVNTHFSRGIQDAVEDANEISESMRDYRWIKFAINYDYGVDNNKYVKYPGDQNYNDPFPINQDINDKPSPYFGINGKGYNAERETEKARLLDVNQLICRLKREAESPNSQIFFTDTDGKMKVAITVFVDEHLYFNHPITKQPGDDQDAEGNPVFRSLWRLTADKEDRQLHIIAEGSRISQDGNSSIVYSTFSFKQRTIRTIYNVENEDVKTAWGLESEMEAQTLPSGDVSRGTDSRNGRTNTLKIILGEDYSNNKTVVHWSDILSTDDHYSFNSENKDMYENAVYACLMRNRDLNGDDIVDANEIRWYLAAIDQLTDIYLGEYALGDKSRLYPSNPADRNNQSIWHYTSSSSHSDGAPWIIWAEEGASRGKGTEPTYTYRCIRNLGISLQYPDENPQELITVTEEASGGPYLIDLSYMNPKSLRDFTIAKTGKHNERESINRPFKKFRVHKDVSPTPTYERAGNLFSGYYITFTNAGSWRYYQNSDPSPTGYRIPNQRELLIMTSRMEDTYWPTYTTDHILPVSGKPIYTSMTAFSLNESDRYGFMWKSSEKDFFLVHGDSETGYVRPVQDVE